MERKEQLKVNYQKILTQVKPQQLVAVSKYYPYGDIAILYSLGHRIFGESRVQDLKVKDEQAVADGFELEWHFIGHLQRNKVKDLFKIKKLSAIHSIDSIKLLDELKKRENLLSRSIGIFLQVNTSGEEQKSGVVGLSALQELVDYFCHLNFTKVRLQGLMTIGKIRTDNFEADSKACFQQLVDLRDQLKLSQNTRLELSMGMSADYLWALEFGSDWIRVGSAIFANKG